MFHMQPRGGYFEFFGTFELNSDGFKFFCYVFTKSIIAKQIEDSWIKHMCIFQVLTVMGHGQQGAFRTMYGASRQRKSPPATCLDIYLCIIKM